MEYCSLIRSAPSITKYTTPYTSSFKNVGSTQAVEFSTVVMLTGASSCVEKFALGPRAPGPMLRYSAYVVSFVFGLLRRVSPDIYERLMIERTMLTISTSRRG
jgi:hypothetical protein